MTRDALRLVGILRDVVHDEFVPNEVERIGPRFIRIVDQFLLPLWAELWQ